MIATTGTYVDSPAHRYRDGIDVARHPLASLAAVRGLRVDVTKTGRHGIEVADFQGLGGAVRDAAVLLYTGWDRHWRAVE